MIGGNNAWARSPTPQAGSVNTGKKRVRRVLIVDDHPIVRQGLRRIMENEEDLVVCGEAETARDARTAIKELTPDVMIADISLKQSDGIELVRDVRAHHPQLPILVLSMHDETIYAERMLSAGANGYIMKQAASEQFLISLRRVLDGGIYAARRGLIALSLAMVPADLERFVAAIEAFFTNRRSIITATAGAAFASDSLR